MVLPTRAAVVLESCGGMAVGEPFFSSDHNVRVAPPSMSTTPPCI
jgi:hypothetical protein